ncbi:MAG TPA: hypothetical protein DHV28_00360 [Ignavibacteriales bacterium]|nr:hypothetical protein [Ignavibacteriales bacterium]
MERITIEKLQRHEKTLNEGSIFPTAANETLALIKSYKNAKLYQMDDVTSKYLDGLLNKYGNQFFMMGE